VSDAALVFRADNRPDYRANSFTIAIRADRNLPAVNIFPHRKGGSVGKKTLQA
jgi:hypothetical protein